MKEETRQLLVTDIKDTAEGCGSCLTLLGTTVVFIFASCRVSFDLFELLGSNPDGNFDLLLDTSVSVILLYLVIKKSIELKKD